MLTIIWIVMAAILLVIALIAFSSRRDKRRSELAGKVRASAEAAGDAKLDPDHGRATGEGDD